jgi:RNA polymerase sigma-70 factor (ECF subfamily)
MNMTRTHPLVTQPDEATPRPAPLDEAEDARLVERAVSGEADAFEQLFLKYRQRVFGVAWRVLHDEEDALDVVQGAFVRAYQQIERLRGESRFYPWIRRIAVNLAIDRLRHKKRGVEVSFDEAQFGGGEEADTGRLSRDLDERSERESAERKAELSEFSDALKEALEKLSASHRTVFLLHAAEGMSYQEIADSMGCNIGTVMSRLFYARRQLQKLLGRHLEGEGPSEKDG